MLNKTLALILLGGHAAVFAASQTAPSALQVAAAGDPYVFAMLLAHASVPSGIVLPYSAGCRRAISHAPVDCPCVSRARALRIDPMIAA
jgi:hypothetical protein